MTVHRRKDSGAWEVNVNGKRISNRKWTHADALKFEQSQLAAEHTLNDALDKWLAEYVPFLHSPEKTVRVAEALRPLLKNRPITDAPLVASEARRAWAKLKPATINRRLAALRRICNLAFNEWQWVDQQVGKRIKLLVERNERHIYLTRAQVEALRMACPNAHAGLLIVFAAFTGLRWSEMLGLTQQNLRGDELHLGARTKNGRPRVIPLHPRALNIAKQLPLPITANELRTAWETARDRCGLHHVHWHDLRHTFASWLVQSGATLQVVKELMGHQTLQMTMRYAHLTTTNLRDAMEKL